MFGCFVVCCACLSSVSEVLDVATMSRVLSFDVEVVLGVLF